MQFSAGTAREKRRQQFLEGGSRFLRGKEIRIEAKGIDEFDRPLVNLYLPDGREVGQILLTEGTAGDRACAMIGQVRCAGAYPGSDSVRTPKNRFSGGGAGSIPGTPEEHLRFAPTVHPQN